MDSKSKNSAKWLENEARRLQQLKEYQILDTEDDSHFDQITRIAAVLCGTPMALITFVDSERQWFKSKVGVADSETPRDIAFCSHGIEQDEVLIIPDATMDSRFKDNPLVTGPLGLRFYAGAPLITSENNRLGMICVADHKPRTITKEQIEMLQLLAKQVMDQLELKNVARILVTRNKQLRDAQADLRETSEFLKAMTDNLPIPVFCKDANQGFSHTIWNQAASEHFGWSKEDVLGKTSNEIKAAAAYADVINASDAETLKSEVPSKVTEFNYDVAGKGIRSFKIQTIPMRNASGQFQYILGVFQDITAEKEAHAVLTHSSKMSSLGEMAAGIAHEINNPLAVIRSKAQSLKELALLGTLSPETLLASTEKIDATTVRISKIISGLRKFARQGNNDPFVTASVRELVDSAKDLCLWSYQNQGISFAVSGLVSEIGSDLNIECRSIELVQVLVNLLNNARDAAADSTSKKWVSFEVETLESVVRFKISDSGAGVPPDIQEKIMQPFFTTKPPGKGTGLGLSISRGIVESHNGRLWLDTTAANTCFVLEIPKTQGVEKFAVKNSIRVA